MAVLDLYPFQKEALGDLMDGKHIAIVMTGGGKTAIAMRWLYEMSLNGYRRVVVITTATKARTGDFSTEAVLWNGDKWLKTLDSFEVISWHKLARWVSDHRTKLDEYIYIADEIQKIKGYSTGMGQAFRTIARQTPNWRGFTATPGDKWIDLMPYLVATGKVKNKTDFLRNYCKVQTFRGFPEITGYLNESEIDAMWHSIITVPDSSIVSQQLPEENHRTIHFKAHPEYKEVVKTHKTLDGELLETAMGACHYLRQLCFTQDKRDWLGDFIENLGTNAVFFCNYIEEEEELCKIAKKVLPKNAKIWRIDGKHHDIPTAETIGKYDIVVAHYASGGEALNLQFINYWVSLSPNYSFSTSVQARGRIKRIGQKKTMFFYYLTTDKTIETDIYKTLSEKRDFSETTWTATNLNLE